MLAGSRRWYDELSREDCVRNEFEDYARGIGIVLVVYGHVLRGLMNADLVPAHHWLVQTDYAIYTFHMPLFFFLSGLHVERGLRRGRPAFLASKLQTVVYPYVLWSILQGLAQWLLSGDTNQRFYLADLESVFWNPFGQFWFLYALFLCQVLVCLATTQRTKLVFVTVASYFVGSVFDAGIFTTALKFFLFFVSGIFLADYLHAMVSRFATIRGVVVTFVLLCGAIYVARQLGAYDSVWALPAAVLGILLVCEVALLTTRVGAFRVLRTLGIASMPIYLAHILFGSGSRIVLMHFHADNLYLQLCVGGACGLSLPLVLYLFVAKLRLEKYFGFPAIPTVAIRPARVADALN
jgi:fucose 4-O-acetylase-like acetyltransferase